MVTYAKLPRRSANQAKPFICVGATGEGFQKGPKNAGIGSCVAVKIPADMVRWCIPSFCLRRTLSLAALLPCNRADSCRMYTSYALRHTPSVGAGTWPPSFSWQGGARFHGALRVSLGFAGLWPKRVRCTRPCARRQACVRRRSERMNE